MLQNLKKEPEQSIWNWEDCSRVAIYENEVIDWKLNIQLKKKKKQKQGTWIVSL